MFRDLEPAINTGVPDHLEDGPVRQGILDVSRELKLVRPKPRRSLFGRGGEDEGTAIVEAIGAVPFALFVIVLLWQFVVIGWTYSMGQHARS